MISHESTAVWSYGPFDAKGSSPVAAFAALAPRPAPRKLKPTIIAPPPFRNDVRENSRSWRRPVISLASLRHHSGGLLDRRQDPRVGATAAEMAVHRRADLIL